MRYTNKHGIDPAIANAITSNAFYDPHDVDISVSQLVKPPRASALELLHDDEIVVDVSDELWMLLGSAVHAVIAATQEDEHLHHSPEIMDQVMAAAPKNALMEERLFVEVGGWKVSGKPDVLTVDGLLSDYKVTSVWSFMFSDKPEWEMQLNFYAELLRQNGYAVNELRISAILRDWQHSRSYDRDYPPIPFMGVQVPLWSKEKAWETLGDRVIAHQQARTGALPFCTKKERWAQPSVWAVMKHGRKKAVKLFDNEAEARLLVHSTPQGYVELRPGKNSRCEDYCHAAPFCTQYQSSKNIDALDEAERNDYGDDTVNRS